MAEEQGWGGLGQGCPRGAEATVSQASHHTAAENSSWGVWPTGPRNQEGHPRTGPPGAGSDPSLGAGEQPRALSLQGVYKRTLETPWRGLTWARGPPAGRTWLCGKSPRPRQKPRGIVRKSPEGQTRGPVSRELCVSPAGTGRPAVPQRPVSPRCRGREGIVAPSGQLGGRSRRGRRAQRGGCGVLRGGDGPPWSTAAEGAPRTRTALVPSGQSTENGANVAVCLGRDREVENYAKTLPDELRVPRVSPSADFSCCPRWLSGGRTPAGHAPQGP